MYRRIVPRGTFICLGLDCLAFSFLMARSLLALERKVCCLQEGERLLRPCFWFFLEDIVYPCVYTLKGREGLLYSSSGFAAPKVNSSPANDLLTPTHCYLQDSVISIPLIPFICICTFLSRHKPTILRPTEPLGHLTRSIVGSSLSLSIVAFVNLPQILWISIGSGL